jgi:hypothetical protein
MHHKFSEAGEELGILAPVSSHCNHATDIAKLRTLEPSHHHSFIRRRKERTLLDSVKPLNTFYLTFVLH